jgi:hypothetical protein
MDDFDREAAFWLKPIRDRLTDLLEACETDDGKDPDGEPDFFEYVTDVLDVEYRTGADRKLRSVELLLACGGPTITLDTSDRSLKLHWGTLKAGLPLSPKLCAAIEDIYADMYNGG